MKLEQAQEIVNGYEENLTIRREGKAYIVNSPDLYYDGEKVSVYRFKNMSKHEFLLVCDKVAAESPRAIGECVECGNTIYSTDYDASEDFCGHCSA
jgi:hypothetical protein